MNMRWIFSVLCVAIATSAEAELDMQCYTRCMEPGMQPYVCQGRCTSQDIRMGFPSAPIDEGYKPWGGLGGIYEGEKAADERMMNMMKLQQMYLQNEAMKQQIIQNQNQSRQRLQQQQTAQQGTSAFVNIGSNRNGTGTIYAVRSTINKSGDRAKMGHLVDFRSPMNVDGKQFSSVKAYFEYDCNKGLYRQLAEHRVEGSKGRGDVVEKISMDSDPWEQIDHDSSSGRLWFVACRS